MQHPDFSNLELSMYQKFVIHTLPFFKSAFFYKKSTIDELHKYGLIKRNHYTLFKNFTYSKTDYGKMYFRIKRKDRIRFLIPTIISILALFGGYDVYKIPELEELLKAIASLLENIKESLETFL